MRSREQRLGWRLRRSDYQSFCFHGNLFVLSVSVLTGDGSRLNSRELESITCLEDCDADCDRRFPVGSPATVDLAGKRNIGCGTGDKISILLPRTRNHFLETNKAKTFVT